MRNWIRFGQEIFPKSAVNKVTAGTGPEHASGHFGVYVYVNGVKYAVPGTYPSLEEATTEAENFVGREL